MNSYNAALRRWEQYTKLSNEIYRKGKNTPDARDTLQEFSLFWQRDVVTLARDYDKGGIREEVPPKPLWTYATSIEDRPSRDDRSAPTTATLKYTKNGDVLDNKPKHLITPLVVRMTKTTDGDWKFRTTHAEGQGVVRRLIVTATCCASGPRGTDGRGRLNRRRPGQAVNALA